MDRLTSCYFCGTALDAPVEEYPVVPGELHPSVGDQATVTLCPTCRRKLTAILEAVLDSVADRRTLADATTGAGGGEAGPAASLEAEPDLPEIGDASGGDDTADAPEDADPPDGEPTAAVDPESGEPDDPGDANGASGAPAVDEEAAGVEPEPESEREEPDRESPSEGSAEDAPDGPDEAAEAGPGPGPEDKVTSRGSADSADREGDGTDAPAGDDSEDVLETPAAKRVVRLLQNREFPVDRGEIRAVASGAYDIPPGDCETVIDALVEGGYVDERDGRLVRTEGE